MTPAQKVKWAIIERFYNEADKLDEMPVVTAATVDADFDALDELDAEEREDGAYPYLSDILSEVREGTYETGVDTGTWSRHYEVKEVAMQAPDGSWVGWPHFFGGGKYGEPEAEEWIDRAYNLTLREEEKMTVVRTWAVAE